MLCPGLDGGDADVERFAAAVVCCAPEVDCRAVKLACVARVTPMRRGAAVVVGTVGSDPMTDERRPASARAFVTDRRFASVKVRAICAGVALCLEVAWTGGVVVRRG